MPSGSCARLAVSGCTRRCVPSTHAAREFSWRVPLHDEVFPGIGLVDFFGCATDIRPDNFMVRIVKPAVADVKASGAFGEITFKTGRNVGRGRPLNSVEFFAGLGDGYIKRVRVPRDDRHVDILAA